MQRFFRTLLAFGACTLLYSCGLFSCLDNNPKTDSAFTVTYEDVTYGEDKSDGEGTGHLRIHINHAPVQDPSRIQLTLQENPQEWKFQANGKTLELDEPMTLEDLDAQDEGTTQTVSLHFTNGTMVKHTVTFKVACIKVDASSGETKEATVTVPISINPSPKAEAKAKEIEDALGKVQQAYKALASQLNGDLQHMRAHFIKRLDNLKAKVGGDDWKETGLQGESITTENALWLGQILSGCKGDKKVNSFMGQNKDWGKGDTATAAKDSLSALLSTYYKAYSTHEKKEAAI